MTGFTVVAEQGAIIRRLQEEKAELVEALKKTETALSTAESSLEATAFNLSKTRSAHEHRRRHKLVETALAEVRAVLAKHEPR